MLSARLLLYQARLILDQGQGHWREAIELLAEAESYLIGRQLRDLEDLASELRQQIRQKNIESGGDLSVLQAPQVDSSQLLSLQQAAVDLKRRLEAELADEITEEKARIVSRHLESFEEYVRGIQRVYEKRDATVPPLFRSSSILGQSLAIRKLSSLGLRTSRSSRALQSWSGSGSATITGSISSCRCKAMLPSIGGAPAMLTPPSAFPCSNSKDRAWTPPAATPMRMASPIHTIGSILPMQRSSAAELQRP